MKAIKLTIIIDQLLNSTVGSSLKLDVHILFTVRFKVINKLNTNKDKTII